MEKFMENNAGKMTIVKPKNGKLDEFFGLKKEEKTRQSNIVWGKSVAGEDEFEIAKEGHRVCFDKMSFNEYQKNAVLEKARKDIAERRQIDAMRANLNK